MIALNSVPLRFMWPRASGGWLYTRRYTYIITRHARGNAFAAWFPNGPARNFNLLDLCLFITSRSFVGKNRTNAFVIILSMGKLPFLFQPTHNALNYLLLFIYLPKICPLFLYKFLTIVLKYALSFIAQFVHFKLFWRWNGPASHLRDEVSV